MASPTRGGLVHYLAECDCGWSAYSKNAFGLAAQHHARCGQHTRVEIGYAYTWEPAQPEPDATEGR